MASTLFSGLTASAAEAIQAQYLLLLADRNWMGNLPTLHYAGAINGSFSNVLTVPHYGLIGYDSMSLRDESASVATTALSDGQTQITVQSYAHSIKPSDIAKMVLGSTGVLDPSMLAMNGASLAAAKLTDLICDVIDGFSATAGPGTGTDLDISSLLLAIGKLGTLNVDLSRGVSGVLHGQQWSDVGVDAETTGGAIQYTFSGSQEMMIQLSPGAKGRWLGVDWFHSNRVVTANAGADRAGAIWTYGGVAWGDGVYAAEGPEQMVLGRNVLFERDRDAPAGQTAYVTHTMVGVSKALEAGVTIISDA